MRLRRQAGILNYVCMWSVHAGRLHVEAKADLLNESSCSETSAHKTQTRTASSCLHPNSTAARLQRVRSGVSSGNALERRSAGTIDATAELLMLHRNA